MLDNDDEETIEFKCQSCGGTKFFKKDGFYYCNSWGAMAKGLMVTGTADDYCTAGGLYNKKLSHKLPTALSQGTQANPSSKFWYRPTQEDDALNGPTEPTDFGSAATGKLEYEDYYNEVRIRYVLGLQWMVQMQCEALINKLGASPLIVGVV